MTKGKSVLADEQLTTMCRVLLDRRMHDLAFQVKPNRAWRLISYQFQGHDLVDLEPEDEAVTMTEEIES